MANSELCCASLEGIPRRFILAIMAIIVALAVGIRLYSALQKDIVGTDESSYLETGRNFWRGKGLTDNNGMPFTIHPGGLGVFVAGVAKLTGQSDLVRTNAYCFGFFGGLSTIGIFILAKRLLGTTTAILSAAVYAMLPAIATQVFYWDSTSETLLLPLVIFACCLFALTYDNGRPLGAIVGSCLLGFAASVRNDGLLFFGCLTAVLCLKMLLAGGSSVKKTFMVGALGCLAFSAAYLPYGAFLWRHTGSPLSNVGSLTAFNYDPVRLQKDWFYREKPGQVEKEDSYAHYIVSNPRQFIRRVGINARQALLFGLPEMVPFYLFAFIGVALFCSAPWHAAKWRWAFLLAMALPVSVYLAYYIQSRFLVVMLPVAAIVVGQGLAHVQIRSAPLRYVLWGSVILALAVHSLAKVPALRQNNAAPELRSAAAWVVENSSPNDVLMCQKPQVPFYAHRPSVGLPWVESDQELYRVVLADPRVKYVVFDEVQSLGYRPALAHLLNVLQMRTNPYFSVVYAQETLGHRVVVLRPNVPAGRVPL